MDENKYLEQLQKTLEEQIDKEAETEKLILESSQEITRNLLGNQKRRCHAIINEREYLLSYVPYPRKDNPQIYMICVLSVDTEHFKISLGNYRPAKIEAEMDKDLTEEENLQIVIESYIRHILGLIKPEELED